MRDFKTSIKDIALEELDRELVARGARVQDHVKFKFETAESTPGRDDMVCQLTELFLKAPSPDEALNSFSTGQIVEELLDRQRKDKGDRGIWLRDSRRDFFNIKEKKVVENVESVPAICFSDTLTPYDSRHLMLKVRNFGEIFNLCQCEPFREQPIAAGRLCTGFLIDDDIVATAGHCANKKNVSQLRIIFGYKLQNPSQQVNKIPIENVYQGKKIVARQYDRDVKGKDWALIRLDRKVDNRPVLRLSGDPALSPRPVYVLGYPCGLPLKYASGAWVKCVYDRSFGADLDVYSGNSGSPVFDAETHEVLGMIVHGNSKDFRWTGKCWMSIVFPNPEFYSEEAQCIWLKASHGRGSQLEM